MPETIMITVNKMEANTWNNDPKKGERRFWLDRKAIELLGEDYERFIGSHIKRMVDELTKEEEKQNELNK